MNERIRELAIEVGISVEYLSNTKQIVLLEKFSELIVRECAYIIEAQDVDPSFKHRMSWAMKEHFGVEE